MSIDTYAELKATIADWLNRDDLTAAIPSFIALAEADISRSLRDWRMEKRATITIDGRYEALPTDWIETIRLQMEGPTARIELAPDGGLPDMRAARSGVTGKPTHYAHTAGGLEFFPDPDATYEAELVYFGRVPTLSDAAPTNWLLTAAPDVYIYGALAQSAPYLKDDARAGLWAGLYQSAISGLNDASVRARFGGSGLRLRNRGMG